MKLYELKLLLETLPNDRLSEECAVFHPYYNRVFRIEAIDELNSLLPEADDKIVFIVAKE